MPIQNLLFSKSPVIQSVSLFLFYSKKHSCIFQLSLLFYSYFYFHLYWRHISTHTHTQIKLFHFTNYICIHSLLRDHCISPVRLSICRDCHTASHSARLQLCCIVFDQFFWYQLFHNCFCMLFALPFHSCLNIPLCVNSFCFSKHGFFQIPILFSILLLCSTLSFCLSLFHFQLL